ncbi:hypothetical protein [Canibacter zhoujuaniae]|uniref:hypothetical protein n=1 Tax=Canibacter zhoujuaniae TaxID=2708343 RepID=UPI00142047D4|nr:hypothetical protein [Canibacter zhoujuaniae]
MIEWFAVAQIVVALLAALVCVAACVLKKAPNDLTMGLTLLSAVGLLCQVVIALVAPAVGNPPAGDLLEFWLYLIVAFALPIGAGVWALVDRTRWANGVLAIVGVSLAVMVYRMAVIWGIWA